MVVVCDGAEWGGGGDDAGAAAAAADYAGVKAAAADDDLLLLLMIKNNIMYVRRVSRAAGRVSSEQTQSSCAHRGPEGVHWQLEEAAN